MIMVVLNSKLGIAVLIILLVLLLLLIMGRKSVKTEISVETSPNEVWSVLTDISKVRDWNNILVPIEGKLEEGNTIKYEFYQDDNAKAAVMNAKVKQLIPSKLINQTGGIPGILTFNHSYILEQTATGTSIQIYEKYRGIMVPFWNPKPVEKAYAKLLLSLKERVIELKRKDESNK